jgi:ribonuclease HII
LNQENSSLMENDEWVRLQNLSRYENQAYEQGYKYIAGLDEVGRGPIAGPVTAAAVILPPQFYLEGVDDSKKLSPAKREKLAIHIKSKSLAWTVVSIYPSCLDEINILNATKMAMSLAVRHLAIKPDYLLIDALQLDDTNIKQCSIIKGDSLSISIACASIIAKVERDNSMRQFDQIYPGYNFAGHKGYATREHLENLFANGPCVIHRKSFEPVKSMLAGDDNNLQLELFRPGDL